MPTATINVAFVNPPKPGKKLGNIKTTDDQFYGVDPTQLGQFAPGGTYTIEYDTHVYQGREYKTFRRMDGALPLSHPMAPVTTGRPAQTQAVEMATMGWIRAAVEGSGTIPDLETLTRWVKTCKWAWIDGFASTSRPRDDEEGDEKEF